MKFAMPLALACLSTGAFAQSEALVVTDDDDRKNSFKLSASFEPNIGGDFARAEGERLDDAVATSGVGVEYKIKSVKDIVITFAGRARWKSDLENDDDESNSALTGSAKINWARGCRRISPFAGAVYEHGRTGFFEASANDFATFSVGADLVIFDKDECLGRKTEDEPLRSSAFTLKASAAIERIDGEDPFTERWTPRAKITTTQLLARGIKGELSLDYQYRILDEVETGADTQHFLTGSVGVNLAQRLFGEDSLLDTASLGVSWQVVDEDDTGILLDQSRVTFTPKIAISKTW